MSQSKRLKQIIFFLTWALISFFVHTSYAQRSLPYLNREFNLPIENFISNDSINLFSPFLLSYRNLESIDSIIYPRKQKKNYFVRKIRRQSFVRVDDKDFYLTLDPIFNFSGGVDKEDSLNEKLITNSRGVLVRGNIGKQFAFESTFIENQATFPNYMDAFADTFKVIPGQGRWKKFKSNGYDYAASQGSITYAPFSFFAIQLGHGKPFIGNGYRSLLLSDNAFNYPFAQFKFHSKFIDYSVIYASLQVVDKVRIYTTNSNEPLFKKKSASFQYLTLHPIKKLAISFFQGTIFQVRDSIHPYFNYNVLNPIIFSSAFQYGLNRSPNVMLGAEFKFNPLKDFKIYGQYVLDDFSKTKNGLRNKAGFQVGSSYFNVLGIKNLIVQVEYNQVRPYTYAHSIPNESYTHYGQSLAHPMGANFKEMLGFINYHWKDLFFELKLVYVRYGADSLGSSYGRNVFASDNFAANGLNSTNNIFLQGIETKMQMQEFKVSYLINPVSNLNLFVMLTNRIQETKFNHQNNKLISIGIKTSIVNNYYDF